MPDQPQPARCAIGRLLWQDIDCAVAEYKKQMAAKQTAAKQTSDTRRGSGIVTEAVTAYFLHKNGDGEDLKPCKICGGKHGANT